MKKNIFFLKKIIPPFFYNLKSLAPAYYYDLKRFYKYSSISEGTDTKEKLLSKIIERYHTIEKGLTMPDFRPGFGKKAIILLIKDCIKFSQLYDENNDPQLLHAIGVIYEYREFHKKVQFVVDAEIERNIESMSFISSFSDIQFSSQYKTTKDQYFSKVNSNFYDFSNSRSSIRNYSKVKSVNMSNIDDAIKLAINAPSACNRQSCRVYVCRDKEKIKEILNIQGGNRGFGHLTDKLLIVTSDLGAWGFLGERYQSYVDGGIFAMNMLYSLHFYKIGACILNCSVSPAKDKRLRSVVSIKESENFIAMISCGELPDDFSKTISKRNELRKVKIDL